MGEELSDEDVAPVQVEGGEIEMVEHFPYLGSVLSCDGEVMKDVKSRIAKASKAFGTPKMARTHLLWKAVRYRTSSALSVQVSAPYVSTDTTVALYTALLVGIERMGLLPRAAHAQRRVK